MLKVNETSTSPTPSQRSAFRSQSMGYMIKALNITKPDTVTFDGAEPFKFTNKGECIAWCQIGKRGRIYGRWFREV